MDLLFQPFQIKNLNIKNRICFPPVVCYSAGREDGFVTEQHIEHYRNIAKGGTGLIIQEATCVDKMGRLSRRQLGIWEDGQIDGLSGIVKAVHEEGCPILIQIHHAGAAGVEKELLCPSNYCFQKNGSQNIGREMTIEEIHQIRQEFVDAAVRAYKAGYDGVELHGCHQYLMCEFFNDRVNKREDEYGIYPERFAVEILRAVKARVPKEFLVGIRLGGFEPDLKSSQQFAKILEKEGINFLDISYGFTGEDEPYAPDDFLFQPCIYAAQEIKKVVSVPVFAVNSIMSPEMAEEVLQKTNVDLVDIARGIMVNPSWANDAFEGRDTGKCLHCRECSWSKDMETCKGRILLKRQRGKENPVNNLFE